MRVNLDAMQRQNVKSRDLDASKRIELAQYVEKVADAATKNTLKSQQLPGCRYRLAFSTADSILNDLPRDADVYLNFVDDTTMEYTLQFSAKTLGLNSIKAVSNWSCNNNGTVTFVYDKITTDVLGMKNVGIGFFGLLQGRANAIETVYHDDQYWIARDSTQADALSVYVKEQDDVWNK